LERLLLRGARGRARRRRRSRRACGLGRGSQALSRRVRRHRRPGAAHLPAGRGRRRRRAAPARDDRDRRDQRPDGDDATGTFWTKYPALELRGHVVCLGVSGNRASVGAVVDETSSPATNPVGSNVHLGITDNGAPGAGRDLEVT
jgi:hypothetical protein